MHFFYRSYPAEARMVFYKAVYNNGRNALNYPDGLIYIPFNILVVRRKNTSVTSDDTCLNEFSLLFFEASKDRYRMN